jgi:hypothetical protein
MMSVKCQDCEARVVCTKPCTYQGHSHWGNGALRCETCTTAKIAELHRERIEKRRQEILALEAHQAAGCPDDGLLCPECCPHDDTDHGICMECEADLNDSIASDAYDRAKARRQDGVA